MVVAAETEYASFLDLAERAALRAGTLIRDSVNQVTRVEHKSAIDLVTAVDRQSEQLIVGIIRERYPGHSIVAEEETSVSPGSSSYRWIIDPLDGTTNFVHGYPQFAVSIAVVHQDELVAGVVHDPMRRETFSAIQGGGAHMNGRDIHTSAVEELDKALLATGFPYDRREKADEYLGLFRSFMCAAQGLRRAGAASLDLCHVAAGRLDGFWERKLHAWDIAAGSLIVREAGGRVTDFQGGALDIWGSEILCSNGRIHGEMVALTAQSASGPRPSALGTE